MLFLSNQHQQFVLYTLLFFAGIGGIFGGNKKHPLLAHIKCQQGVFFTNILFCLSSAFQLSNELFNDLEQIELIEMQKTTPAFAGASACPQINYTTSSLKIKHTLP